MPGPMPPRNLLETLMLKDDPDFAHRLPYLILRSPGDAPRALIARLIALALRDVDYGDPEAEDMHALLRDAEMAHRERGNAQTYPAALIDEILDPLERLAGRGTQSPSFLQAVQALGLALRGEWSMRCAPWRIGTIGTMMQEAVGLAEAARSAQTRTVEVSTVDGLDSVLGVVIGARPDAAALVLAGVAIGRGLPVVSLGDGVPGFPVAQSPEEAIATLGALEIAVDPDPDEREAFKDLVRAGSAARAKILEAALVKFQSAARSRAAESRLRSAAYIGLVRGTDLERPFFDIYANGVGSRLRREDPRIDEIARLETKVEMLERARLEQVLEKSGDPEP